MHFYESPLARNNLNCTLQLAVLRLVGWTDRQTIRYRYPRESINPNGYPNLRIFRCSFGDSTLVGGQLVDELLSDFLAPDRTKRRARLGVTLLTDQC